MRRDFYVSFKIADRLCASDDPWNQTAADTAEWLRYFKINTGITKATEAAAVASDLSAGYAPPYSQPQPLLDVLSGNRCPNGLWVANPPSGTNPDSFLPRSTNMFNSQELEAALVAQGRISDRQLTETGLQLNAQETAKAPVMGNVSAGGAGRGDAALEEMDFDFGFGEGFGGVALNTSDEEWSGLGENGRRGP